jgi:Ca2+-binding EF-hand superfamily protein
MDNKKIKYISKKTSKDIFKDIDKNNDNHISKKELHKYLKTDVLKYFTIDKKKKYINM